MLDLLKFDNDVSPLMSYSLAMNDDTANILKVFVESILIFRGCEN